MSVSVLAAIVAVLAQSAPASASDGSGMTATAPGLVVPPPPKCLPPEDVHAPAPRIVSSFPAEGQVVRPGLVIIRITFDRPMTCGGFLGEIADLPDPCPPQRQAFIQSFDHRTIRTACLTQPGQAYGFVVGGLWSPPFMSLDGQRAPPLEVRFQTSGAAPVTSARDALAEDAHDRTGLDAGRPIAEGPDLAVAAPTRPTVVAASAAQVDALEPQLRLAGALAGGARRQTACAALAGRVVLGNAANQSAAFTEQAATALSCR